MLLLLWDWVSGWFKTMVVPPKGDPPPVEHPYQLPGDLDPSLWQPCVQVNLIGYCADLIPIHDHRVGGDGKWWHQVIEPAHLHGPGGN